MSRHFPNPLVVMALEMEAGTVFKEVGVEVLFTGVGKVNAAHALTRRLAEYVCANEPLPFVVNFGTAGSGAFRRGSLVVCRAFVQRDMDVSALNFDVGVTPYDSVPSRLLFPLVLEDLPQGVCGTGDSFAVSHEDASYDVLDMEAFALAKVCWLYESRFISVKYITDNADSGAASDWQQSAHEVADQFLQIYKRVNG